MGAMNVRVVTPDKVVFDGEAINVVARGLDGDFAVFSNHCPMLAPLGIGELKIVAGDSKNKYIAVDGGILEVSQNRVNILSRDALLAEEIDVATIQMKLDRAKREQEKANTREEQKRQDQEMHKLINQINVSQHHEIQ